jgi:hypothetical protein
MLALAEILLTILAYRRGWKLKALLPVLSSLLAAFMMGLALGAGGGSMNKARPAFLLVDLICLAVLIVFCVRSPKAPSEASLQ